MLKPLRGRQLGFMPKLIGPKPGFRIRLSAGSACERI
jgi:hypothetical protein